MLVQEVWSEWDLDEPWEDTLGLETQDDDAGVSDLTIFDHSNCLPMDGQLESAKEVIAGFE